nr:putative integron gene cassette protein [uncultured bacterium]
MVRHASLENVHEQVHFASLLSNVSISSSSRGAKPQTHTLFWSSHAFASMPGQSESCSAYVRMKRRSSMVSGSRSILRPRMHA